ncbi:MAG: hypothetical protein RL030_1476, partial [Pseudomonadota bacterium]
YAFGAQQVIDVLRGERTEKVLQRGHDLISTFGIGADTSQAQWRAVLRQLVTLRLVAVDHDNYNVLRLTEASREVLRGERRLTLRRESAAPRAAGRKGRKAAKTSPSFETAGSPGREAVFQALREWRRGVAKEHGVPAYTVLHDSSLREIAQRLPENETGLLGVAGIGAAKLARYGQSIVEIVSGARATPLSS